MESYKLIHPVRPLQSTNCGDKTLIYECLWADTATLVKSRVGTLGICGVYRANCGVKGTCGVFDLLIFV